MKCFHRIGSMIVLLVFFISSVLYASQAPSRVKIDFEKVPKVELAKKTLIKIKGEALEDIENVDKHISLPAHTTLLNGNTKHNKDFMQKGQRFTYILEISVDDSVMDRISVTVLTEKDGIKYADNADLYFVSYGGAVELLTQEEISDQSQRIWKAPKLVAGSDSIKVIPISYEDSFIQLEPDLEGIEDSVNYVFEEGKPFVTRGPPTKVETPGGLGKGTQAASITVNISGTVNFWDSNSQSHSFANGTVEFWDDDVFFDDYLGSTTTNASGYFSKTVSGTDGWFDSKIEIYLKIKTSNSKVRVYNQNGNMYNFVNGTVQTSGGTINWGTVIISWGSYQACSIFNWMNESWNFTNNNGYDPGLIKANYPNSAGSYFRRSDNRIYIENDDWYFSAEDVTRHEYGHNLMYNAQDEWWPSNTGGYHTFYSVLHENMAWTEGWATAFAQFVDPDGFYDGGPNFTFGIENQTGYSSLPQGYTNEARVAAALTDLFDNSQDGDDYIELAFSLLVETIRDHNNDDSVEFWDNLKSTLSQSDKHYASRALRYNTIDVPLEPLPDPLSVTISGPWSLGYKESGTFTANVSGGSGTITYQWYKKDDGSSTWYTLGTQQTQTARMFVTGFTLKVVVTRGSENAEDTQHVEYEGELPKLAVDIPKTYGLSQNQPNPFNPSTTIKYDLPEASSVSLVIYDIRGYEIIRWAMDNEPAGYKRISWNGTNYDGRPVPTGMYICRLTARSTESKQLFIQTQKMVLLR